MEFQTSSKKTLIILIALALKTVLSIYSVWSYEFINMAKASTVRFFVGNSSSIPWIYFNHLIYEFWRWLIPNSPINLEEWLILLSTFPNSFDAYLLVFLFKLPILLADMACGFLIYFLAKEFMDHKKAFLASIVWLWNPYVTLNAEMLGTNDLILLALTLLSLLLFIKKRFTLSFIPLMLGIAFRLFPLLLLPIYSIYLIKDKKTGFLIPLSMLSCLGLAIYAHWIALTKEGFLYSLLEYDPLTQHFSEITLEPYGFRIGLSLSFGLIYCFVVYEYWKSRFESSFDATLGFLLIFLSFLNWYPQYLLWVIPLLTLDSILYKEKRAWSILWLLTAFFFQLIIFDFNFDKGLFFIPNYNQSMENVSKTFLWIQRNLTVRVVVAPFLRACFTGIGLIYSAKIALKNFSYQNDIFDCS